MWDRGVIGVEVILRTDPVILVGPARMGSGPNGMIFGGMIDLIDVYRMVVLVVQVTYTLGRTGQI
ncbi:hypothetical protein A8A04_01675 [Escherichia coli]|nr:hypothetical protein A8A04_01675 [Escherichia coli]